MRSDPTTTDPTLHCFWEALSDRARKVVAHEAGRIATELRAYASWAPLNCDLASQAWAKAFRAAGVPVQVISGHYWPEADEFVEPPGLSDHVWLLVEGAIFDPTAGQFGPVIEARHYLKLGTIG